MAVDILLLSALLAASALLLLTVRKLRRYNSRGHLPPGPTPFPILGNVLDIPRTRVGPAFSALTKKYGDLVYFNLLGQPMVVIGSVKAAFDLLDKKSANFSGRYVSAVVKLAGLDSLFVLKQYGLQWRQHRRAFHLSFGIDRVANHRPIQLHSARRLLSRLLTSPHNIQENISMLVTDSAMASVYGIDAASDDPECEMAKMIETLREFVEPLLLPGGYALEIFPFLRHLPSWLPGMHMKRTVEDGRRVVQGALDKLDSLSTAANREGRAMDSMMTRLLADCGADEGQEAAAKEMNQHVTATTVLASSETTQAAMEVFFLAAAMHPACQKAAQAELDAVVGPDRLPEFSDYGRLPYVRAFVKELTRWHVSLPMGVPHMTVEDDECNGYFIPAGTIVNVNLWAFSRDPDEYPDPDAFRPERFLGDNLPPRDPADYVFGFGRRVCPGRHFAAASLFIYCAALLHVFDIMPPKDEDGNTLVLEYSPRDSLVSHVEVYDYIVKPRSAKAQSLVADLSSTF
ncbi:cytochrome P450 [Ganoderma sinense ZZ0214-1]|uniref:Cytochrome P450 n=1 Tax=Ganoderma sinense ZZ0214-1 TaxID=1077348 RepID=A0A2G8SV90_9APHY|nr:cytochrome P450 [Ganoderma sinense ZZ0214-1]